MNCKKIISLISSNLPTLIIYWGALCFLWLFSSFISSYNTTKGLTDFHSQLSSFFSTHISFFSIIIILVSIIIFFSGFIKIKDKKLIELKNYPAFFSHAIITTISQFSIFGIGIFFSVLSSPIKDWMADGKVLIYPNAFKIVLFLLFVTMLTFLYNIVSSKVLDSEKLDKIEKIIQLAPSSAFSRDLSHYTDIADDWAYEVTYSANRECLAYKRMITKILSENGGDIDKNKPFNQLGSIERNSIFDNEINDTISSIERMLQLNESYIRCLLVAYARLTASFDGRSPDNRKGHRYRANLMIKLETKQKESSYRFKFIPDLIKGSENNFIESYLELDKKYSINLYTSKRKIFSYDESSQLCTPLPFNSDEDVKSCSFPLFLSDDCESYNCFGAPTAVYKLESQFIPNTEKAVDDWKVKEPGINLIEQARSYYKNEDKARSIISIPLLKSRCNVNHVNHSDVIGVVNIYRDEADIMHSSTAKLQQFSDITTSLNSSLSRIIISNTILQAAHQSLVEYNKRDIIK